MEINIIKLKEYASQCTLLYLEDDELIRTQTVDFLHRFFNNITVEVDGEKGLNAYKNSKFDIVITDINMPNMNGIEMIEKVLSINEAQKIMVTSAYNDSENLMKLINLNVHHFILKPFNNKQFLIQLYYLVEQIVMHRKSHIYESIVKKIVQMVDIGIIVIENSVITMTNQAFLDIGNFKDINTLKLEAPQIGIIFQQSEECLTTINNNDFIQSLINAPEYERKVRVEDEKYGFKEYQVGFIELEESQHYALTFTNITAIHHDMLKDEHTLLPNKKGVLEAFEVQKNSLESSKVLLVKINNFDRLMQWYGKSTAIQTEKEAAKFLLNFGEKHLKKAYLGYFDRNRFIFLLKEDCKISTLDQLHEYGFKHNAEILEEHINPEMNFHLRFNYKVFQLQKHNTHLEYEFELTNLFDSLD